MSRMHSKGRGRSGSTRPISTDAPDWSQSDPESVEALVLSLAEEGHSPAVIGTILRDRHAVPSVKAVCGERIVQILSRNGHVARFPEDMMNLMRKALRLIDHLDLNRKDLHNLRQLELTEARIRRLARYYIGRGVVDSDWTYKRDQLRLLVE